MSKYRESALESLMHKALTDRAEALTSLEIMLNHPAGIGDHKQAFHNKPH